MRKLLFGCLIGFIIGGLAALIYFITRIFAVPYPEKVFPDNTLFYVFLHNVSEASRNFENTELYKQVDQSPRKDIYRKQLDRTKVLLENTTGVDFFPLFEQFTKEIAFGVFPLKGDRSPGKSPVGIAFTAYIKDERDSRKFFDQQVDPNLKRRLPDLSKESASYGGIQYYRYKSSSFREDFAPCYYINQRHLVVTASDEAMRLMLDVRNKKSSSLRAGGIFKEARKQSKYRKGVLLYVNFPGLFGMVDASIEPGRRKLWSDITQILGIEALQTLTYNIKVENEGFVEEGLLLVRPERKGLLKIYFEQPAIQLDAVNSIPPDARAFSAGSLSDFGKMWTEVNSQLSRILPPEQHRRWEQSINLLRGLFNFDINRDLLDPVGNQFAFFYEAGSSELNPESMKYFVALQLDKPDKFRDIVDRIGSLASLRGLDLKKENYRQQDLQVMQLNFGTLSFTPAYSMKDSWFYFSTDSALLKKSIDARASGKSIAGSKDYQRVTSSFPRKVNSLSYTNVQSFLRMYSSMLKESGNVDSEWIDETQLQQELIYLSEKLFGAASYSRIEKEGLRIHSYGSVPSSLVSMPAASSGAMKLWKYRAK